MSATRAIRPANPKRNGLRGRPSARARPVGQGERAIRLHEIGEDGSSAPGASPGRSAGQAVKDENLDPRGHGCESSESSQWTGWARWPAGRWTRSSSPHAAHVDRKNRSQPAVAGRRAQGAQIGIRSGMTAARKPGQGPDAGVRGGQGPCACSGDAIGARSARGPRGSPMSPFKARNDVTPFHAAPAICVLWHSWRDGPAATQMDSQGLP